MVMGAEGKMQQAREEGGREERPNRNQQEIDPKRQGERPEVLGRLLPFPSFVVPRNEVSLNMK